MKTIKQVRAKIEALRRLASSVPDDHTVQASIAGQINVLEWAIRRV